MLLLALVGLWCGCAIVSAACHWWIRSRLIAHAYAVAGGPLVCSLIIYVAEFGRLNVTTALAIYGVALILSLPVSFLVSPLVRRHRPEHRIKLRLSKGRCPMCNYDLQHDYSRGCPECGWFRHEPG